MADYTPSDAIDFGSAVLSWGSDTYHGITNCRWSGRIDKQVVKFSSSTGATSLSIAGGPEDQISLDIVLGAGDAATPNALKRGSTDSTCELHIEGDSAGNVEIIFEEGLIESSELGGSIGNPAILSLVISCNGDLTIQDAV